MMNHKHHLLVSLLSLVICSLLITACYKYDPIRDKQNRQPKDQPQPDPTPDPDPTKSADSRIIAFDFDAALMAGRTRIDHKKRTILVPVLVRVDVRSLKPIIQLADKAKLISPDVSNPMDFNAPRLFVVEAENGSRTDYLVRVLPTDPTLPLPGDGTVEPEPIPDPDPTPQTIAYTFSFEEWSTDTHPLPIAPAPFGAAFWISASNTGYTLAPGKVEPYPVIPYNAGYKGKAVQLKTRPATKLFGMGTYVVAASLFSGAVDKAAMISKPLESTLFGRPIGAIPRSLTGYYQYEAGPKFVDGNVGPDAVIAGQDRGMIAVVFFEVNNADDYLNGKNIYTDGRIVAMGRMEVANTSGGWQKFSVDVEATNAAKYSAIDFAKKKYKVAILFSSSYKGDLYQGAVDSQLLIDEISLNCQLK